MRRWIAIVVFLVTGFLVIGLVLTGLQCARQAAIVTTSANNLREIALFAHIHVNPDARGDTGSFPRAIPPATVVNPLYPPGDRLSWAVHLLPVLDRQRQDVVSLLAAIDANAPWSAEVNQDAGRTPLVVLICPGVTPQPRAGAAAITSYVGIAGLSPPDPATLPLPADIPPSARAGAFRYDTPTPFDSIADGLSQTLLFGETANEPGPWLRGGYSTVRGFDDSRDARPLIGAGGQFGGYFPNGAHFAMCDGGVRLITPHVNRSVLLRLAAIADGKDEVEID